MKTKQRVENIAEARAALSRETHHGKLALGQNVALRQKPPFDFGHHGVGFLRAAMGYKPARAFGNEEARAEDRQAADRTAQEAGAPAQIGRASCRERVCQYV